MSDDPAGATVVAAPGRVNLIGEHTDYNDGFVLPAAISLGIRIAFEPADDGRVEVTLAATGERAGFDLVRIPPRTGTWIDYVAGTAWSMGEAGLPLRGFRGVLTSDLPESAGLSSSAALELVSAWALSGGEPPTIDPLTIARIAQRAENDYVGVRCGLMDQFASSCGRAGHALLLDCRSLDWSAIPMPSEVVLVICHTGVPRRLGDSAYNERRADCERAVATIAATDPSVMSLRDVDLESLQAARDRLDDAAWRRARHVIEENARVLEAVDALGSGDLATLGRLFAASHASLRDLFEVSSPELDALVDIATSTPGVVAARMTGAGFGGCTVNLVRPDAVDALRAAVAADYGPRTGRTARIWTVEAAAGAGRLPAG